MEQEAIKENSVQKIYIRYFDIDLDAKTKEAFPRTPIHFTHKPTIKNIVPVVYIKNEVMLASSIVIDSLAQKTFDFIHIILNRALAGSRIREFAGHRTHRSLAR